MQRHRGLFIVTALLVVAGFLSWYLTPTWDGWEYILDIVGKGDNMPIAGLIPIIAFFTYLSLDEAFRHDRLIKEGREDEVLDEMYKEAVTMGTLRGSPNPPMLDRVAVHQTRLRTPGLGLDAKGVALGAKGLVLLPSIDRLVAFLALYTRQGSLADILRSLSVEVVKSKLGAREVTLTFTAESSDRLARAAEVARLAGGYAFTGPSRHFVQYRDAAAPFGYDIGQITPSDSALALYHNTFSQTYDVERKIEVRALLLRLEPHPDPATHREVGQRWICAEAGLGPALIQYFVRSSVEAEVGV